MDASPRIVVLLGVWVFLTVLGCAQSGSDSVASDAVLRPDAPASYDFLVARQLELDGKLRPALEAYARAIEKDPESAYLQRKYADLAWRVGSFDDSLTHAERAHELAPDDPDVRVFLGKLYRMRKDAEGAERVLRDDAGVPLDRDAALLLYAMYLEGQRLEEALAMAEWLVEQEPDGLRGYFALSKAYEDMGRPSDAEAALRQALEFDPDNISVYSALARLQRQLGDREAEIAVYREVLAEYPHHHGTLVALADALIGQGRTDEAREALEDVVRYHPGDVRSVIRLALLEADAKQYDAAADRLEATLDAHPEEYELAYFLGMLRMRSEQFEVALDALERVPSHHVRYVDAQTQVATIQERRGDFEAALEAAEVARQRAPSRPLDLYVARLRAKTGRFDEAVAFLEGLLRENPEDDELLYNIGVLYGEARRFDEALQYMQRAQEVNPENASVLNYIGYTWADRGEKLDEAEAMIVRAQELRPDDGYIVDSLGWVYYQRALPLMQSGEVDRGRELLQDALRVLERAAQLTGGDPVISEHLGDVYLLLDDKQRAFEKYQEAIGLEPREEEQPKLQQKYESLRLELESQ